MSEPIKLPVATLLPDCPHWPTMNWVPLSVIVRLESNVEALKGLGCVARRADVVGARVVATSDLKPSELAPLLVDYRVDYAKELSSPGGRAGLMLRCPSPISVRLDELVAGVRDLGFVAYRHEVIGTMIAKREPEDDKELAKDFDLYRQTRVEDWPLAGVGTSPHLRMVRPEQGPRRR